MLENTLLIKCMGLGSIFSQMATVMKVLGMRVEDRGSDCTLSGMEKLNQAIGKMEFLMCLALRAPSLPFLLLLLITLECLTLFR